MMNVSCILNVTLWHRFNEGKFISTIVGLASVDLILLGKVSYSSSQTVQSATQGPSSPSPPITKASYVDYKQRMQAGQREVAILDKEIETLNKHLHKV
jgi:hypothetical protein